MKIILDVENKMIEIEGNLTVADLNEFLSKHSFDPKEWKLRSKVIQFEMPVYTPVYIPPNTNPYPIWGNGIIYCSEQ